MIQSLRRTREFTGPTPHSCAILAKPTHKIPPDHLILERRRIEELRDLSIAETKYNKQCDLKSAWEKATDKKIQQKSVKRQVEWHLQREKMHLEIRRERLRDMLMAEEGEFIADMEAKEETVEDRQENMRQRANFLKQKREDERQKLVHEKLDQKFRSECEELRATLSQRQRDELFREREGQIRIKEGQTHKEKDIEQMYAEAWEKDRLAKAEREEMEAKQQMESNRKMLEILNLQKSAVARQKEEERQIKQMEAEWLKEESAIRKYEEEKLLEERRRKQQGARRARDVSIKLKNRKEGKEKQEQLAMDMKILSKVMEDTKNEEMEDLQRKKTQREENQRFMHYVEMTRKGQKHREKELEKLINEEVEAQWSRKDAKKLLEKEARQALMGHVSKTRKQQICEREGAFRKEHSEAMRERQELLEQMEEHKRLELEKVDRIRRENKMYQDNLSEQIKYQRRQKDREIQEARREIEYLQDAEREYQRKLQQALKRPDTTRRQHPFRIVGNQLNPRAKSC